MERRGQTWCNFTHTVLGSSPHHELFPEVYLSFVLEKAGWALQHRARELADRLAVMTIKEVNFIPAFFYLAVWLYPCRHQPCCVCNIYISHMLECSNFTYCQEERMLKKKKKGKVSNENDDVARQTVSYQHEGEQPGWGRAIPQDRFRVCSAHIANLRLR